MYVQDAVKINFQREDTCTAGGGGGGDGDQDGWMDGWQGEEMQKLLKFPE